MKPECACGQRPVDNSRPAVENAENPARKILDAMSLNLKTPSYKPRTDSQPTGARDVIHRLAELDSLVASILEAIDLINARIDAIENTISQGADQ